MTIFLPPDAVMPKSITHLKKFIMKFHMNETPQMQHYCSACHTLLQKEEQCNCNAKKAQFITVPLAPQIKLRLEGIYCIATC